MGLIKAAVSAIGSTFGDQFLDGIKCEDMGNDILMKRVSDSDGTITQKSRIIVAPGQIAVIYDSGKVMDATAEPGVYTFDSNSTPSFFGGSFGAVFKEMWDRFKFGGSITKDQAVYFFNAKEIIGNKFGTPNPIPYKDWGHALLNARTGGFTPMRLDIKCFGTYTFKICDPARFMSEIAGSGDEYRKDQLVEQVRSEVLAAFTNVLNSLGEDEHKIEALSLPNKTDEIKQIMSDSIFDAAIRNRGISLVAFAIESVTLTEESKIKIDNYELAGDQYQQQGTLTSAYAQAVQDAAKNSNGAMNGFMGIGMMNMAGSNAFGNAVQNVGNSAVYNAPNGANPIPGPTAPVEAKVAEAPVVVEKQETSPTVVEEKVPPVLVQEWTCTCGKKNSGKFCEECGTKKEDALNAQNGKCPKCGNSVDADDKFCGECGEKLK